MRQTLAAKGSPIADVGRIRVLASPVRQDIMDAVRAVGPCSVAELADVLDMPADGLYYHVRLLLRAGLLMRVNDRSGARGDLRVDVTDKLLHLKYEPSRPANRAAISRVVASLLRSAERGFRRSFTPGVAVVDGPARNLWAGRVKGDLSPREIAVLNALLHQLIELMRSGRHDRGRARRRGQRSLVELTFVLAPAAGSSTGRARPRRRREARGSDGSD